MNKEQKKIYDEIWADLLNLQNSINISVYRMPLLEETRNFVDFFREEVNKLIKKYNSETSGKVNK